MGSKRYTREERTKLRNRIRELISEGMVQPLSMAVILNKEGFRSPLGKAISANHVSGQLANMKSHGERIEALKGAIKTAPTFTMTAIAMKPPTPTQASFPMPTTSDLFELLEGIFKNPNLPRDKKMKLVEAVIS